MRIQLLAAAVGLSLVGCESKPPPTTEKGSAAEPPAARAPLVDLTAASSLAPVRAAFNAHRGEARFLTLLAPT